MMKFLKLRSLLLLLLVGAALVMSGCRTAPIKNVDSSSVDATGNYSLKAVGKAIKVAGAGLGWQMKEVAPGKIVGTLHLRDHMAQIDIPYTQKSYSIQYKDSRNLNYDGTKIHKNYNGWISRLDNAIRVQLSNL